MSDYPRSTDDDDLPLFRKPAPSPEPSVEAKLAASDVLDPVLGKRETSKAAARDLRGKTGTLRRQVYDVIAAAGEHGATDDEIQAVLGIPSHSQTPRRGELEKADLIKPSGIERPTRAGRMAMVWIAKVGTD